MKRKIVILSLLLIGLVALGGLPLLQELHFSQAQTSTQPQTANELWNFITVDTIVSSPIVSDGFVYATSLGTGSGPRNLYCLNASTGNKTWSQSGSFSCFPTVANGKVYIGQNFFEASQSALLCLNGSNGVQLWTFTHGTNVGSPLIEQGVLYVGETNYTYSTDTSIGSIYALNATTGSNIWNFTGSTRTSFAYSPLMLYDGVFYALSVFQSDINSSVLSGIYAFNASTGIELWSYTAGSGFGSLTVADQTVYVCSNYVGVLAFDAFSGEELWDFPIVNTLASPVVANNTVYVVTASGVFYALNGSDGNVAWDSDINLTTGSPMLVNGRLYVGTSAGVCCVNASDGFIVWNFKANDYTTSSSVTTIAYADGVVYAGYFGPISSSSVTEHNFYALNALSGNQIWNYTMPYAVLYPPTIDENTVYIGATPVTSNSFNFVGVGAILALETSATSSPSPSLSPTSSTLSHSIPEFPTWIILPLALVSALTAVAMIRRRKHLGQPFSRGHVHATWVFVASKNIYMQPYYLPTTYTFR